MQSIAARVCQLVLCLSFLGWGSTFGQAIIPTRSVELTGTLEVLQEDDFDSGTTRRIYLFHESATGKTYTLRFRSLPQTRLLTGLAATIRGHLVDGTTVELDGGSSVTLGPQTRMAISGVRKALVMIVDFQDEAVSCSDGTVEDKMFSGTNSVDGLYQDTSFGAVSFPPDTDGNGSPDLVRVAISALTSDNCNYGTWAADADSAAQSAGFDLGSYHHRVYVLPNGANCGWAGLGNVGCGSWCRSWNRYCNLQDVYAHELGHNLALRHASTDSDNDGTIDCEYCDSSDFMGYGGIGWRQTNGPHKLQMDWLPPSQVVDVAVGAPQIHVISPLEVDPATASYPQLLRMPAPSGDYYYLSYRRKIGYDASLKNEYADRTAVHTSSFDGSGNSSLIVSLADSDEVTDGTGLRVTQVSHDATSATLLIEDTSLVCTDGDGDGYGSPGSAVCSAGSADDCNDGDPERSPGAMETCNGVDDNCDGQIDEPRFGSLPDGTSFAAVCTQFQESPRPRQSLKSRRLRDRRSRD